MEKKNKSATNASAELHFASSLNLEQAVILVGDIADEHHQVTLTEVSPNEFQFHIDYLPEQSKLAEISGTLQRWNGTETKIDADGTVYRMEDTSSSRSNTTVILSSISLTIAGSSLAIAAGQSQLIIPIFFAAVALGYYFFSSEEDDNPQTVLFRHRDYLLQRLIDTFKSAGDVDSLS